MYLLSHLYSLVIILTIMFLLQICVTTLLGEAHNYQEKPTEREYVPNRQSARSFDRPVGESSEYNQNAYDHRRFIPSYTGNPNYPPHGLHSHNHDRGNHNNQEQNMNFGTPRWYYASRSNRYPDYYNNYYQQNFPVVPSENYGSKYSTERTYPHRHPVAPTERYNEMTTKKDIQSSNSKTLEQLTERNNFDINLDEVFENRNNIKRKSDGKYSILVLFNV